MCVRRVPGKARFNASLHSFLMVLDGQVLKVGRNRKLDHSHVPNDDHVPKLTLLAAQIHRRRLST